MKISKIAFLVSTVSSLALSSLASASSTTEVQIKPWWPVNCQEHNYPLVNQVSEIQKLSETDSQVVFGFKTVVGDCERSLFNAKDISPAAMTVTERSSVVLFQKVNPVISQTRVVDSDTAFVKLTFDKKNVFKHKNKISFDLAFFPNGRHAPVIRVDGWGRSYIVQYPDIRFLWTVDLLKIDEKTSQLRLRFR